MSLATIRNSELHQYHGSRGFKERRGVAAWPTTDAACTLAVPGLLVVDNVQLTPVGQDEVLYWNDTLTQGKKKVDASTPVITLGRTSGTALVSGALFSYVVRGR